MNWAPHGESEYEVEKRNVQIAATQHKRPHYIWHAQRRKRREARLQHCMVYKHAVQRRGWSRWSELHSEGIGMTNDELWQLHGDEKPASLH